MVDEAKALSDCWEIFSSATFLDGGMGRVRRKPPLATWLFRLDENVTWPRGGATLARASAAPLCWSQRSRVLGFL